jgi:2-keto-4-pentenoate hydratase
MAPASREKELLEAANIFLNARRTHTPIADLPPALQPTSLEEATIIHAFMAEALGETGGWKIGAPSADATPFFAPMPRVWMSASPANLDGPRFRYRGLEAEIAFLVGSDLPVRTQPYTREEVLAAVASCHPVIEELESALIDPAAANRLSMLADIQSHGALIYGPAFAGLQY